MARCCGGSGPECSSVPANSVSVSPLLLVVDDPVNPDCVDCGGVLVTALVECAALEMRPPDLDAIYAFKYESL